LQSWRIGESIRNWIVRGKQQCNTDSSIIWQLQPGGRFPQNSQAAPERNKNQKRKNGCYDYPYSFVLKSPT